MTTDQNPETTDHDTTEPQAVRVPNVRPTAISGLDHVLLNPDAAAAQEEDTVDPDLEPTTLLDEQVTTSLSWIREAGDDEDERVRRGDSVWAANKNDDPDHDRELAQAIAGAVGVEFTDTTGPASDPDGVGVSIVPGDVVTEGQVLAPGTELTTGPNGELLAPDGSVYTGPVTESAPGTEPLVTTAIDTGSASTEEDGAATAGDGVGEGEQTEGPDA